MERRKEWPLVEKGSVAVKSVIEAAKNEGRIGYDIEFSPEGPAVIGVGSKDRAAAWWWSDELGHLVINAGVPIAAHSGLGADRPVTEKALGVTTPLELWRDSMILSWIVNPDLASVPKSTFNSENDSDSGSVIGMLNLWACTSLLHDIPNWKECIGQEQCLRERRPCPEHDELAYCALDAWAGLIDDYSLESEMERLKIPWSYYEFRAQLTEYCYKMQGKGVRVDLDVIAALEETIQTKKSALFPAKLVWEGKPYKDGKPRILKKPRKVWEAPFNPNSPKAVTQWFREQGIELKARGGKDSMGKEVLRKALDKHLRGYGLELRPDTGDVEGDYDGALSEPLDYLLKLYQKTVAGKGLKSWFDTTYILNNEVHPRFNSCGTSMSRLSSSKPNFQNVPKRGFGTEVRRAVVARPGYKFVNADFSSGEVFVCLWFARSDKTGEGLFEWLVEQGNGIFEEAGKAKSESGRQVAKSVSHAANYGEGLTLLTAQELSQSNRILERKAKALLVFDGQEQPLWDFRGRYVCFTGANLAERLFGDRTRTNRARALELQEFYFNRLPELRDIYQRETLKQVETSHEVRLPSGHRLPLYGRSPEDDVKMALACKGQGGLAIYAQEGMINFGLSGDIMNFQVHDEYNFEVPEAMSNKEIMNKMRVMVAKSKILPGFTCPCKVAVGANWLDKTALGTLRHV